MLERKSNGVERICNSSYNFDLYLWIRIMTDELDKLFLKAKKVEFQSDSNVFNQVKVYDKNGKLLKIISSEELKSKHWRNFLRTEEKTKSGWIVGKKKKKK